MSDKTELYVYSLDGETWRTKKGRQEDGDPPGWETREEALEAGREQAALIARLKATVPSPVSNPTPVWTGYKVGYEASAFFPSAADLLDAMSDIAEGEVGGDNVDAWPDIGDVSGEAEEGSAGRELHDFFEETFHPFLEKWAETHDLAPTFWSVTEVVKHADDDGALAST